LVGLLTQNITKNQVKKLIRSTTNASAFDVITTANYWLKQAKTSDFRANCLK